MTEAKIERKATFWGAETEDWILTFNGVEFKSAKRDPHIVPIDTKAIFMGMGQNTWSFAKFKPVSKITQLRKDGSLYQSAKQLKIFFFQSTPIIEPGIYHLQGFFYEAYSGRYYSKISYKKIGEI